MHVEVKEAVASSFRLQSDFNLGVSIFFNFGDVGIVGSTDCCSYCSYLCEGKELLQ